ncbi:1-deoxy-D-xylulose 5-phosphate reductoisomerase, partial [Striga asiatica]
DDTDLMKSHFLGERHPKLAHASLDPIITSVERRAPSPSTPPPSALLLIGLTTSATSSCWPLPTGNKSVSETPLFFLRLLKEPPGLGLSSLFLFNQFSNSEQLLPDSKPHSTLFSSLLGSESIELFLDAQLLKNSVQAPLFSPLSLLAESSPIVGLVSPRWSKFPISLTIDASLAARLLVLDPHAVGSESIAELVPIELLGPQTNEYA